MDVGRRKKGTTSSSSRTGVVAGSVWESRMKLDEVKGGIKVFNDEENVDHLEGNDEMEDVSGNQCNPIVPLEMDKKMNLRPRQSPPVVGASGKRKTWKSESLEGSPIQIARKRSEVSKNLDEQCKELSLSADGIKKSPIQNKKTRSEAAMKELSTSVDGIDRSPIAMMKTRSASRRLSIDSSDTVEKNSTQLRKLKSDAMKALNENGSEKTSELRKVKSESIKVPDDDENAKKNSLQLVKAKSISSENFDDNGEITDGLRNGIKSPNNEKKSLGIKKTGSDENCKEVVVYEEKNITTNLAQEKSQPKAEDIDDFDDDDHNGDEEVSNDEDDVEIEIEKERLVVKEISVAEQKPKKINVVEEKKFRHNNERPITIPSVVKKQSPPLMSHARVHPSPPRTKPISDEPSGIPRTHRKLQSFVDLVMWRNVSKSALVFGIGTFVILSSSYTKDLNISVISILSYLGLIYLAAIFLFRSFISRGAVESDDSSMNSVFGHQEAVWFVDLVLPYVNEFLVNIRALFSGDPLTTMKMAVLLFGLARCGSSITIWKMAKLGFFGVFTVPKICSSYSTQLSAFATFWIHRFLDAWDACSHKKAVAFGLFTVVWNFSSVVARIWAVFMLFVAFRYFRPSLGIEEWAISQAEKARTQDSSRPGPIKNGGHNIGQRRRPIVTEPIKPKTPS